MVVSEGAYATEWKKNWMRSCVVLDGLRRANPTLRLPLERSAAAKGAQSRCAVRPAMPVRHTLAISGTDPIRFGQYQWRALSWAVSDQEGAHATASDRFRPLPDGKRFHARTPLFVLPSHIARYPLRPTGEGRH
jgi:hypothetical protein